MRHRTPTLVLVGLLSLVGTACEMRAVSSIAVEEDGSGTIGFVVAVDEELRELMAESGAGDAEDFSDPEFWTEDLLDMAGEDVPDGMELLPYEDGEFLGVEVSLPFDDPEELASFAGREELGPGGAPALTVDGDTYRVSIPVDTSEFTAGVEGMEEMDIPFSADSLFDISYIAELPGEITDTNGTIDPEDPSRVTWDLDLDEPDAFGGELHATSMTGGFSWWIVAAGILALVVAALVVAYRRILARDAAASPVPDQVPSDATSTAEPA